MQVRHSAPVEQLADDGPLAEVAAADEAPAFQAEPERTPTPVSRPAFVARSVPVASAAPPRARRAAYIRAAAIAPLPRSTFRVGEQVRSGEAPVVVQLGAFRSEANAERAWQQVASPLRPDRAAAADHHLQPSTAGPCIASRSRASPRPRDAQRLCGQIRSHGGVCFVRATAGDASIRWAARYPNPRQRDV